MNGPKIKLLIAYDGTRFGGWQKQNTSPKPTVQGTLEDIVSRLFQREVRVIGASRTDAGVHALGQVAHFAAPGSLKNHNLVKSLNAMTPDDLMIRSVRMAPDDFHAIASSNGKIYRYLIHNHRLKNPFRRDRTLWVRRPLDLDLLNQASRHIIGEHDFKSFQTAGTEVSSTIRSIYSAAWRQLPNHLVEFRIQGSGFLKQMVRNLVGTLLDLEQTRETPEMMKEILDARDRRQALTTAAPQGLYLVRVLYPEDLDIRCRKL